MFKRFLKLDSRDTTAHRVTWCKVSIFWGGHVWYSTEGKPPLRQYQCSDVGWCSVGSVFDSLMKMHPSVLCSSSIRRKLCPCQRWWKFASFFLCLSRPLAPLIYYAVPQPHILSFILCWLFSHKTGISGWCLLIPAVEDCDRCCVIPCQAVCKRGMKVCFVLLCLSRPLAPVPLIHRAVSQPHILSFIFCLLLLSYKTGICWLVVVVSRSWGLWSSCVIQPRTRKQGSKRHDSDSPTSLLNHHHHANTSSHIWFRIKQETKNR